eukprot:scaffold3300_cov239-Pinguiococcus_pyrenoidosus.AAC.4
MALERPQGKIGKGCFSAVTVLGTAFSGENRRATSSQDPDFANGRESKAARRPQWRRTPRREGRRYRGLSNLRNDTTLRGRSTLSWDAKRYTGTGSSTTYREGE